MSVLNGLDELKFDGVGTENLTELPIRNFINAKLLSVRNAGIEKFSFNGNNSFERKCLRKLPYSL